MLTGCSSPVEMVSLLSASWNLPIVAPVATQGILANKATHKTLTRMTSDDATVAGVIIRLLRYFQWSTIVIIEDLSYFLLAMRADSFIPEFIKANISLKRISFNINEEHNMEQILEEASRSARGKFYEAELI